LFPLCMIGGILLQLILSRREFTSKIIDANTMERLSGASLDFLICAAIAGVNLGGIADGIAPVMILFVCGALWHCFLLFFVAFRVLPNHWFERAVTELSANMGVIASGLVMLRMVDPQSKTPVPADFAYKQLLSAPIMGGGIWTATAIPLLHTLGPRVMLCITVGVLFTWILIWKFHFSPKYLPECPCKQCTDDMDLTRHHDLSNLEADIVSGFASRESRLDEAGEYLPPSHSLRGGNDSRALLDQEMSSDIY
jgi:ESS family glutamate:Na+ symporter